MSKDLFMLMREKQTIDEEQTNKQDYEYLSN
jgi:hypothetical protein